MKELTTSPPDREKDLSCHYCGLTSRAPLGIMLRPPRCPSLGHSMWAVAVNPFERYWSLSAILLRAWMFSKIPKIPLTLLARLTRPCLKDLSTVAHFNLFYALRSWSTWLIGIRRSKI